ncbi:MAG TPA: chlorophyll synthesis pathway protein BchC [Rhodospirillaceae bacterium]|nr:chlorophyll synthesis pathway protein BchC [Rhodospirillaceae bacterium]
MDTIAVVMEGPESLSFRRLALQPFEAADVVVEVEWSGISAGTERLLWTGCMPHFPGMGYPLVPGYESVGKIVEAGADARSRIGQQVFVPGAACFKDARGLFGGAARRLIVPGSRAIPIDSGIQESGVLIALASTAYHAMAGSQKGPELIVGHGVLGRLLARLTLACGHRPPTVWETNPGRRGGAAGYQVLTPETDSKRDYEAIFDVSGDASILDTLIGRLARGGEIVLAGFYEKPLSFTFPPSFMREARIRIAAEWKPEDLAATLDCIGDGRLSLDGLITHRMNAENADLAYRTAFGDVSCLKMVLDWRNCA